MEKFLNLEQTQVLYNALISKINDSNGGDQQVFVWKTSANINSISKNSTGYVSGKDKAKTMSLNDFIVYAYNQIRSSENLGIIMLNMADASYLTTISSTDSSSLYLTGLDSNGTFYKYRFALNLDSENYLCDSINSIYFLSSKTFAQSSSITSLSNRVSTVEGQITTINETIGDISSILDEINGEVV